MKLLLLALLASACTQSATKTCGDFTCSEQSVCSPDGQRCVSESQIDACKNVEPGMGCSFPGTSSGVCSNDVCTIVFDSHASADTALIVGAEGVLRCKVSGCKVTQTGTTASLLGAFVLDDKHAFIVGTNGTILY